MAYPSTTVFNPQPIDKAGLQPILTTSTTQLHPIGSRVQALDLGTALTGVSEYIYLVGVASTAAGDVVVYNQKTGATIRLADDAGTGCVAVAMSANVATQYGWYAVSGCVPVSAATVAADKPAYMTATPGQIDDAVVTGDLIVGMQTATADSASFAYCTLGRPFVTEVLG